MDTEEIFLHLEKPKYNALQCILRERGTDLETVMQARLEAYYRETVPVQEQGRINEAMEAARLVKLERQEASRHFTAYRVREGGAVTCFESELCLDAARSAARIRASLRGERAGGAGIFANRPEQVRAIDGALFALRANAFQDGDERIRGVIDVDLDAGTFKFLDREQGWLRYTVKDISTAAYHAFRREGRSDKWAARIFQEKLQGKELPPAARRLTEQDVRFSQEIEEIYGKLNFYMDVNFNPDEVFGTHVETSKNGDWLNVYANYDMEKRQLCDKLDLILHRDNGQDQELHYVLDDAEKAILLAKMDAYCIERDGMSLEEYTARMLEEQAPGQEAGMAPLQ